MKKEKKVLTKNQTTVLEKIKNNRFIFDNFYLTGGTALAAFYLHHRYSEDLDFFSEQEFDVLNLSIFFNQLKKELAASKIDFQQSYNRNLFFLHFDKEILKTEFTFFPFPRIKKERLEGRFSIDSLLDIATNKLFSIYQRSTARDYIDLYFIYKSENLLMEDLVKTARAKFDWHIDPIQLGAQFIKAKEVKDFPRMIKKVKNKDWQDFFVKEAKNLKPHIFK